MVEPVEFLERYFLLESTGKPIVLEDWQKGFLGELFNKDISLAVLSATKKTGKSTLAAGIALYVLLCWPSPVEVLFIANSKEQTKTLAFRTLAYACKHQPELAKSCTVYRDKVVVNSTGAIARCIPTKAKSVAGASPSLVVFDEAWGLTSEDENLFSELTSIPTKRSLVLVCSYAGLENQSPLLKRLYDLGTSDKKPDDMFFFWNHNPKLSSWVSDSYLESQRAKLLPHQFERLFGNVWTSGAGAFILSDDWEKCLDLDLKPLPPGSDELMYYGLDIGVRKDHSCLVGVVKEGDAFKLAHFKSWQPGRGKSGEIELEAIYEYVLEMHQAFNVSGLWYDPRYATSLVQRWKQRGVNCLEMHPQASNMARTFENLAATVKAGRFVHWGEKLLSQHVLSSVATISPYGAMIEKPTRGVHIDGCIALSLSLWGASQAAPPREIKILRGMPETYHNIPQSPTSSRWIRDLGRGSGDTWLRDTARHLSKR